MSLGRRSKYLRAELAALTALTVTGCTSDSSSDTGKVVELIGRDWSIPPGEYYKCIGIQVDRDMYVGEFRTLAPIGEHHTVVTVSDKLGGFGGTQLGEYDCQVLTADPQMIYASGVGTGAFTLPDGVALKIEAGQFLHLNLHLYNASDETITTRSSIEATLVDPVPPEREAEMVFAGTFAIDVPVGQTMTTGGGCTFTRPGTLFAYWPHMHQYATHQKLTATIAGTTQVLHDEPFNFEKQLHIPFSPLLEVSAGDSIRTECTYTNTGTATLHWGDSSDEEMCFTGLYRYPKQATTLFDCTEGR